MLLCPRCSAPCGETHSFCFACGAGLEREAPREDPLLGQTLPGGYRVTHVIGAGGMGRVYCAEQVALGRTVAVKVVHPHLVDDELAAARFLNEARTASRLSHPHSVAIFDFGRTEQGQPYIVMEYLRGRDLSHVVHDEGPLPLRRITEVLRQTLAALEEAHALGIVHRDLKPDNIVLEALRSGLDFVKVVDFGLAKILDDAPSPSSARGALTRPGLVCGTPEYMSPEQGRGDALDGRADLYSLGVVLFELLAGRVPFQAETPTRTLLMHLNDAPPDPRTVAPDRSIPASFAELTLRALAKPRADRFQTAHDFSAALEQALAGVDSRPSFDAAPTTSIRCRACGALNGVGQKFCGDCGQQIKTSKPGVAATAEATRGPEVAGGAGANANAAAPAAPRAGKKTDAQGPTVARTPAVGGDRPTLPLLARAEALEWLEARHHEAEAMFALAHVMGDAGSGKTRLVSEFAERCTSRGDVVVAVGPDPAWARVGDSAVRDAISALCGTAAARAPDVSELETSSAARQGIETLWGLTTERPAPTERRRRVAEALRWAVEVATRRSGSGLVVLLADDVDFIDGASRNAFFDLVADPPACSALLLVTSAPGPRPGSAPTPDETWTLPPLPVETFKHLLPERMASGARPMPPLHVEQLLAWARESRDPAPDRLPDLILARVGRLAPDARMALYSLAVWGDDATVTELEAMLPAGADASGALDALTRSGLVVAEPRGARIAHPLLRRLVFSAIPAGVKRDLFARSSPLRPEAPLELRARQALHGGSAFEALSLLEVLSGRCAAVDDQAGRVGALRRAVEVTRREMHRGELDDPLAAMLVFSRKLAEALCATGGWNDAEGVLREALGNAPPTSVHRARLLGVLATVAQARGRPDEARRYFDEAMRLARASDARELVPLLRELERSIEVA